MEAEIAGIRDDMSMQNAKDKKKIASLITYWNAKTRLQSKFGKDTKLTSLYFFTSVVLQFY